MTIYCYRNSGYQALEFSVYSQIHPLAVYLRGAENGAVRAGIRLMGIGIAVLCVFLGGSLQAADGASQTAPRAHTFLPPQARIDINHASVSELMKVPGMTQSWAGRIVRFRPYYTKQDLLDRGVVTSQVYDRIKDYVIAHRDKPRPSTRHSP